MQSKTFPASLTTLEQAMLAAQGISQPRVEELGKRSYRVIAIRTSGAKVEALGASPEDGTRNLIKMVVRR